MARILAVAFGFAFKMISEIDWWPVNRDLAHLLGIKTQHFNQMESAIFKVLDCNIGVLEEKFNERVRLIDDACKELYTADQEKIRALNCTTSAAVKIGVSGSPASSSSSDELRVHHY